MFRCVPCVQGAVYVGQCADLAFGPSCTYIGVSCQAGLGEYGCHAGIQVTMAQHLNRTGL